MLLYSPGGRTLQWGEERSVLCHESIVLRPSSCRTCWAVSCYHVCARDTRPSSWGSTSCWPASQTTSVHRWHQSHCAGSSSRHTPVQTTSDQAVVTHLYRQRQIKQSSHTCTDNVSRVVVVIIIIIITIISDFHHQECVLPLVGSSLQSCWFWATMAASVAAVGEDRAY